MDQQTCYDTAYKITLFVVQRVLTNALRGTEILVKDQNKIKAFIVLANWSAAYPDG